MGKTYTFLRPQDIVFHPFKVLEGRVKVGIPLRVETVAGQDGTVLLQTILKTVQKLVKDKVDYKEFKRNAKCYGSNEMSCEEYLEYLLNGFGAEVGKYLTLCILQLEPDGEKSRMMLELLRKIPKSKKSVQFDVPKKIATGCLFGQEKESNGIVEGGRVSDHLKEVVKERPAKYPSLFEDSSPENSPRGQVEGKERRKDEHRNVGNGFNGGGKVSAKEEQHGKEYDSLFGSPVCQDRFSADMLFPEEKICKHRDDCSSEGSEDSGLETNRIASVRYGVDGVWCDHVMNSDEYDTPLSRQVTVESVDLSSMISSVDTSDSVHAPYMNGHFHMRMESSQEQIDHDSGKFYTDYVLKCSWSISKASVDQEHWLIPRRYREFQALDILLRESFPRLSEHFPELPAKRYIMSSMSLDFVQKRRKGLQHYLYTLLRDHTQIVQHSVFDSFAEIKKHVMIRTRKKIHQQARRHGHIQVHIQAKLNHIESTLNAKPSIAMDAATLLHVETKINAFHKSLCQTLPDARNESAIHEMYQQLAEWYPRILGTALSKENSKLVSLAEHCQSLAIAAFTKYQNLLC